MTTTTSDRRTQGPGDSLTGHPARSEQEQREGEAVCERKGVEGKRSGGAGKVHRESAKLLLKAIRATYAACRNFDEKQGYRKAALCVLNRVEENSQADELWSSVCDEAELTMGMRIGEHLAVTRRALGFVP